VDRPTRRFPRVSAQEGVASALPVHKACFPGVVGFRITPHLSCNDLGMHLNFISYPQLRSIGPAGATGVGN
jgi:hypothetical protein